MKIVITVDDDPVVFRETTIPLRAVEWQAGIQLTEIDFLIGLDYIDSLVNAVEELFRCGTHTLDYGVEHRFRECVRHSRAYTEKWRELLDGDLDRD